MSKQIDISVVGASTPIGEALLEQLAERKFTIDNLIPLAFDDDTDTTIEFAGKNIHIQNIATFNFSNVPLVFLCQLDESYQGMIDRILDAGCRIIEIGSNLQNAPMVVANINSEAALFEENQHIRSATGLSVVLSQLLSPIVATPGIKALQFTALQSVSDKGKAGVDELAMQTTSLLNTRPIKPSVFKKQIAFNVMTDDSDINNTGFTANELDIIDELKLLLTDEGDSTLSLLPSLVHIPVFYGVSIDINLELNTEMDLENFRQAISSNSNIVIKSEDDLVTPVSHAAQMDQVFVNRLRTDMSDPRRINFWCVTDTIRSGSAINGVQIGEILVKHHL